MKKWTHTLLISTIVLGTIPYGAINASIPAEAVEVGNQTTTEEKTMSLEQEKANESLIDSEKLSSNQNKTDIEATAPESVKKENTSVTVPSDQIQKAADEEKTVTLAEQEMNITPRRTSDFIMTIDGLQVEQQQNYYCTNVTSLSFVRFDEYNVSYEYDISYGDSLIVNVPNNNVVDLSTYTEEGIYIIDMTGFNQRGRIDTGEFYNNVQRTASSVNVGGIINTPGTVVENPSSIAVGRDEKDTYGEYHFTWEIRDAKGNVVLSGTDTQPNQADIDGLDAGEYTITNTVTEEVPAGYEAADITDTTSGAFKITAGKVDVEHILLDEAGNIVTTHTTENKSGKLGSGYETTPIEIPGYELVVEKMPTNQNGTYEKNDQTVKYYYKKIKTTINIEYVDEQGKPLVPSDVVNGEYDADYTSEAKEIPGYELVEVPTNATGKHTDKDQTVQYVYKKKATKVTVNYVDEQGKPLAESDLINGLYDDPYNTAPKPIPGYILTAVPTNASGKHTVDPTEVTYVYKKIEAPTVDDTVEGSKEVTGTGMPDSKVVVTFPNGAEVTVDVDKDGKWTAAVPEGVELKKNDKITAVTLDPLTGVTSDSSAGKVTPLPTKTSDTGSVTNKPSKPDSVGNTTTTTTQTKPKLPNTGETDNTNVVNIGLLSLLVAFLGKYLHRRKAE
ncbi:MucBP domain-containing protein [Candidatus Enterococcus ikei]|uniref:MucBP domain-containing protein n=1 Tax=Candidatus Enterococcus ikei TaxID=2815326 RepID=A0ABS3GYZ7_9ENTE|nr:MucBP domain-containing protein [Enterococcus sp. DIV0869a]MBO0440123.1 MucBP domain-containing protein [Enterococcus sp. DIV0869a]